MPKYLSINRLRRSSRGKESLIRLDAARKSDIRGFLEKHLIEWDGVYVALSTVTIEATDNPGRMETYNVVFVHRGPLANKKHTELYVRTKYDKIDIQYYEYWKEAEDEYILERIYINFTFDMPTGRRDAFAIHVDPLKKGRYPVYESVPHYHFYLTPRPLSKMHIPLDPLSGQKCIEDYQSLKKIFMSSIKALSFELETRHRLFDTKIAKFLHALNIAEA